MPFFRISWGVGVLNSTIFNSFHNRVEFGTILEGLRNFGVGGFEPPLGTPLCIPEDGSDRTETCSGLYHINNSMFDIEYAYIISF